MNMVSSHRYNGPIVYVDGKPFAIAKRVSANIKSFSQDTGRFSTTGPPLAQLPVKMRKLFAVDPGMPQLGYDYSGIEALMLAQLAGDQILLDTFANGWDVHMLNACDLFEIEYPSDRTKTCHTSAECADWRAEYDWIGEDDPRRKFAKVFMYRTMYGGSAKNAHAIPGAAKLGMTKEQLEHAVYRWLAAHPALQDFWQKHGQDAIERFCVRSITGRRRILVSPDDQARFRQGINHPIQSFVSDVVINTINMTKALAPKDIFWLTSMHDSLLWAIRKERFEELVPKMLEVAQSERHYGGQVFKFPVSHYTKEDMPLAA